MWFRTAHCALSLHATATYLQLGITFASTLAGRLVVALVAPEGEAAAFSSERGGIEAGDVLWSINGMKLDPAALSAEDQLQKLQTMDYPVTLIFKRPNESGVCTPGTVCALIQYIIRLSCNDRMSALRFCDSE
jgi:hypothetical protein